ncbi:hydroxyacid dehydrogenase [Streptomyces lunaelactis]|uniref:NAD(P)-dependent oxidoreductase n=1 Tax=Streptomyces lunaelactis TaxID=1535768 RepID=UPI0015849C25|nr:NAD(P)-dependent oxidoreductase [Streptomyces lunaelactis]NUK32265.1 hydroxyacid dehydrogenase [Streptomyces lunaelactis]
MPVVVAIHGSCSPDLLREHLPGAEIYTVADLGALAEVVAQEAEVLVLRSGQILDAPRLKAWPALRHVIRAGSGLDGIDTTALAARGIAMHRNPHPAANAVAEWALAALLSLARRIPYGQAALTAGQHTKRACLTPPVAAMRLAIWGAGPVGRSCARVLGPHVAEIAYAARASLPDSFPSQPAQELLAWADAHLVALPLTEETRGQFGAGFLAAARTRRPLLICVGRLATLDLDACLTALARGDLSGLALDPIEQSDLPLLAHDSPPLNLLATPHIGAQRTDVRARLDAWVATTAAQSLYAEGGVGS